MKIIEPTVFQESIHHTHNMNILAQALYLWDECSSTSYDEINFYPRLRCLIKFFNDCFIHKGVHFNDHSCGFASLQPAEGGWVTVAAPAPGEGLSAVEQAAIPPATMRVPSQKMRFEREDPTVRTLRDSTNLYQEKHSNPLKFRRYLPRT